VGENGTGEEKGVPRRRSAISSGKKLENPVLLHQGGGTKDLTLLVTRNIIRRLRSPVG